MNCDVGEGVGNEALIMPYIQSCNIACGGHAGNEEIMNNVVKLALKHGVRIGAHPSYPDIENFGRKRVKMNATDLINSIRNQIEFLKEVVVANKAKLHHIKAHGALYNDIASDLKLAEVYLKAVSPYKGTLSLYVPYNSRIEKIAKEYGFSIVYEAFADRNYNNDLSLVSRSQSNAIIKNSNDVINHIAEMVNTSMVTTIDKKRIPIKAATFCVHSDTENAVDIIKAINTYFNLK